MFDHVGLQVRDIAASARFYAAALAAMSLTCKPTWSNMAQTPKEKESPC